MNPKNVGITDGPWETESLRNGWTQILGADGRLVAQVRSRDDANRIVEIMNGTGTGTEDENVEEEQPSIFDHHVPPTDNEDSVEAEVSSGDVTESQ